MALPKIKFAVGIAILFTQLFLYINAEAVYGPYASMVRNVMLAYFVLLAVFSPYVIKILMGIGPKDLPSFSIMFAMTAVIMLVVGGSIVLITGEVEKGITLALGFGFLHGFVKAFNEEVIFRGVLPMIMGGSVKASIYVDVISSVAFGVFHLAVTGVNIYAMIFLSALGFVWAMVRNRFGIMGSTGSHFAYNLGVMGVLPVILGGV